MVILFSLKRSPSCSKRQTPWLHKSPHNASTRGVRSPRARRCVHSSCSSPILAPTHDPCTRRPAESGAIFHLAHGLLISPTKFANPRRVHAYEHPETGWFIHQPSTKYAQVVTRRVHDCANQSRYPLPNGFSSFKPQDIDPSNAQIAYNTRSREPLYSAVKRPVQRVGQSGELR